METNNTYKEFFCPFYKTIIDEAECYDYFVIASRLYKDGGLVKEADKDALLEMCHKCGNYKK